MKTSYIAALAVIAVVCVAGAGVWLTNDGGDPPAETDPENGGTSIMTAARSGTCGADGSTTLTWKIVYDLIEDGDIEVSVLQIFGYGDMENYNSSNPAPWKDALSEDAAAGGIDFQGVWFYVDSGKTATIGAYAFYQCTTLPYINWAATQACGAITEVGNYAFKDCTGLDYLIIPDSITSIGSYTFSGCTNLSSMTMKNSVTSIGDYAFSDCTKLASVTISDSVTSIGNSAFKNCTKLASVDNYSPLSFTAGSTGYGYIAYYATTVNNHCVVTCTFASGTLQTIDSKARAVEIALPDNTSSSYSDTRPTSWGSDYKQTGTVTSDQYYWPDSDGNAITSLPTSMTNTNVVAITETGSASSTTYYRSRAVVTYKAVAGSSTTTSTQTYYNPSDGGWSTNSSALNGPSVTVQTLTAKDGYDTPTVWKSS